MSRPWLVCSRRWMSVHSSQPRPTTGQWEGFLLENIEKIFAFPLFSNTGQVVEILPGGREGLTYSTLTVPWVLISWRWWTQGISSHGIDGVHVLVYTSFNTTLLALGGMAKISTHWGRVTHICIVNLIIIGSVNGLSPDRRQAITWANAGILLIGTLGTNFSEILIAIYTFSFKEMRLKVSSAKWRPICLGLNVLIVSL